MKETLVFLQIVRGMTAEFELAMTKVRRWTLPSTISLLDNLLCVHIGNRWGLSVGPPGAFPTTYLPATQPYQKARD